MPTIRPFVKRFSTAVGIHSIDCYANDFSGLSTTVLCASHPIGPFNEETIQILNRVFSAPTLCTNPAPGRSIEEMVDDIEQVRKNLGIDSWVFWGMSGGGWLAQLYAHRYPRSLKGVIIESSCPDFRLRLADPECIISPFHPAWKTRLLEQGLISEGSHSQPFANLKTEWIEVDGVGSVLRRLGGEALLVSPSRPSAVEAQVLPHLLTFSSLHYLNEIRVPSLVICGEKDPVVPVSHGRAIHTKVPGSLLRVIPEGGHVPTVQGGTEICDAVRAFLKMLS